MTLSLPELGSRLGADATEIIGRYPKPRSALMPVLHLVQAEQGYVTEEGIMFCAERLGLEEAEVSAVASFYTMFKRRPAGEYHVGVCTNSLCAVMGGDAIFADLKEHLGVGNDETTQDGKVSLEHLECNAACDYPPVMLASWEFFDNMTPRSARDLVDGLRPGADVVPTRGAPPLGTWQQASRLLAGFRHRQGRRRHAARRPTASTPSQAAREGHTPDSAVSSNGGSRRAPS